MNINDISEPIEKQNVIVFLKLTDKRKIKAENINVNELKKKLTIECSVCIFWKSWGEFGMLGNNVLGREAAMLCARHWELGAGSWEL